MIAYVGIDAHTTNYTLSTYFEGSAVPVNTNTYSPAVANIVSYCSGIRKKVGNDTEIVVGYEAGCAWKYSTISVRALLAPKVWMQKLNVFVV